MTSAEVHLENNGRSVRVGSLHFHQRRSQSSTFQYAQDYLASPDGYPLEPLLPLAAGPFQSHSKTFGAFEDSAPDRWGRLLMDRRERQLAREQARDPRSLTEADYVLGVTDETRQGALRYRRAGEPTYLSGPDRGVPTIVSLPSLLRAVDRVTDDDDAPLKQLLDAGTASLGGARPKAAVRDGGRLLLAKFPHRSDEWDVMGWEKTVLDLAEMAGITVSWRRLERVGDRHVLIVERFDRSGFDRVGYLSARTLLEATSDHADYSDLAEALETVSTRTTSDLHELWRRILFSLRVNNTDDHLRNHGVLRSGTGWGLSPMFDVNPNPDSAKARVTSILGETRGSGQYDALIELAPAFRLKPADRDAIVADIDHAVAGWVQAAKLNGINDREISLMRSAFGV